VGDIAFERSKLESAPQPEAPSPWSPPVAPSPAVAPDVASGVAPGVALAAHTSPAYVPLVPRGPISGRMLLVGATATLVGLISISIAGMLIGGDQAMTGHEVEPPVRVEEMLLSWIAPVLELGAEPGALPPGVDPNGPSSGPDALPSGSQPESDEPAGDGSPAP
jgi:hypothetical protein